MLDRNGGAVPGLDSGERGRMGHRTLQLTGSIKQRIVYRPEHLGYSRSASASKNEKFIGIESQGVSIRSDIALLVCRLRNLTSA
jgi:hypothetical protein